MPDFLYGYVGFVGLTTLSEQYHLLSLLQAVGPVKTDWGNPHLGWQTIRLTQANATGVVRGWVSCCCGVTDVLTLCGITMTNLFIYYDHKH